MVVDVPELLQHLSRVRNVQFNSHQAFRESRDQDISAMIIQAAGQKVTAPCSKCKVGRGPFRGCYVVPSSTPLFLRQTIPGCANCFYQRCPTYCDVKRRSSKTTLPQHDEVAMQAADKAKSQKQPERQSMRVMLKKSLESSSHPRSSPQPAPSSRRSQSMSHKIERLPSPSTSANAINPSQMLELEIWEVAPGRIQTRESSETVHSFAFSNAYLTQNQVVRIGRDISFQIVTVKPGTAHTWETSADKVRLCSIASGKLHVRTHDQEFWMGPNGMIRIKPGADCTVMNNLYVDAVVHVAAVPGDLC
ncbi:hypothetical protein GGR52DRAFT_536907 [Hypoxylon sp. FL1284]|nr:hypothetical protein GGR52DRAFT_536907 [Hypoxylon sp. FL1284]